MTKTIKELIAILQMLPPDMRVIVSGYEGGYDDPGLVTTMRLRQWVEDRETTLLGLYEEDDIDDPDGFDALVIARPC